MELVQVLKVGAAVARRPTLWATALAQVWRLAPRGWWRRRPFTPLPDPAWMRFRLQTMYGDGEHDPEPPDVIAWLEWCRGYRRVLR